MNDTIQEIDLHKPVSDYFTRQGYEIRSEIRHCDIAGIKNDVLLIVELKKGLTIELLSQAVKRQKFADMVYMAVPKPKNLLFRSKWQDLSHLIRRLELGLLFVSFKGSNTFVEEVISPQIFDRKRSIRQNKKKRGALIREFKGRHKDFNTGGSKGKKLVTAYRENALYIACCLSRFGVLSVRELKKYGSDAKKTSAIVRDNVYGWFGRIDKTHYCIHTAGKKALKEYKELTDYFKNQIAAALKET